MPSTRPAALLPAAWVLVAVILASCAPSAPSPSAATQPGPTATSSAAPSSVTPGPTAPVGLTLPDPGRPFDAEAIRIILDASSRPDGVPAEALTSGVLEALAEAIWTFDGNPWQTADGGGTCGAQTCQLEIAGTRDGHAGDDLWVVEIDRSSLAVEVVTSVLQGVPTDLLGQVDTLARQMLADGTLEGAVLTGGRWLPPPDQGRFVLAYRTAGTGGGCGLDVTLDAVEPRVVEVRPRDC